MEVDCSRYPVHRLRMHVCQTGFLSHRQESSEHVSTPYIMMSISVSFHSIKWLKCFNFFKQNKSARCLLVCSTYLLQVAGSGFLKSDIGLHSETHDPPQSKNWSQTSRDSLLHVAAVARPLCQLRSTLTRKHSILQQSSMTADIV